ncbi:transcription-repair coupling factor [Teredinibacter sp. KSP-S5-2]|uniref:transcription-repair coupling factor n=1 Tax=Teredinibacter sp. KSP-S5-2 TaxID=3034506 RepID=UPI00293496A0|nr:transcription-repair coupling factor [Teredinibacter sp. KSP-S5-2]WNO07574.1 transcription-repair coupling factor [Teredinibacter sp. KSP-S5-2]
MSKLFGLQLPTKRGNKNTWGNLPACSAAFAIVESIESFSGTSMVIAQNMSSADRIERDLLLATEGLTNPPKVMRFADWETLPYDSFSPHQDIVSERMRCLYQLGQNTNSIVVVSAPTLLQRLPPKSHIIGKSLFLKLEQTLNLDSFRQQLTLAGYNSVDTVFQHGEFAVRGSLIDVYPMGSRNAYRIELFDDSIESLRTFDPETQRTISQVDRVELLPGKECPLDAEGISLFKDQWHAEFDGDPKRSPVYQDVCSGISPGGVEYYLPLFFKETASLFDYLPEETHVFAMNGFEKSIESFVKDTQSRYDIRCVDPERPILPPHKAFHTVDGFYACLKGFPQVLIHEQQVVEKQGASNAKLTPTPALLIDSKAKNPLYLIENFLCSTDKRVLFCAESNGRKETLLEQLLTIGIKPESAPSINAFTQSNSSLGITIADIEGGFNLYDPKLIVIAESQLYGRRVGQRRRRKSDVTNADEVIKNLTELKIGAPVVHIDHGVGRYQGLTTIEYDGLKDEFLELIYADNAKLFVPVANLHLISRYTGAEESLAPLHRLGSEQWQRAKKKAAEQVRDVAAELLNIYAQRQARKGYAYTYPKDAYQLFAAGFPFEETPDQEAAIYAVRDDMQSPQPMDRLVCGDVGFGKTEVAMRAAFIAVENSKQVAVLVPTTLLAQQHYENFRDRFADWPVNVEVISRFKSTKETTEIQKRLEAGKVDILIGTHKLIQGDLKFPDLGLLIIDEEHRFGVRQKEALKALRSEVDILTMTATPIPRTLNMSMQGIRDLSIIATPPAKRLSVKTFVRTSDNAVTKEAILREIMRGGQVYYLHNEVKTIEKCAADLQELIPEAKIQIGHGQMRERELEAVMSDFYHKRFNILVCTTIIETGIDVPTANTIIIDRADKFGLAQLHQLRGRVGRSHHQAYAYLLTPNKREMTTDAQKRLDAIAEAQDLGAGFTLASHDLEIRGAGELLGEDQSGQMQTIGFSLYMDMLDRAVKALKEGKEIKLEEANETNVDINLRIPALIPDDYIPDVHTRLTLYKRLASTKNEQQLNELQVEMIDRFGLLPEQTKNLIRQTRLRFTAEKLGISKVETNVQGGKIEFAKETAVEPLTIVKLVQTQPQNYKLEGANQLKFIFDMNSPDEKLKTIHSVFEKLAS